MTEWVELLHAEPSEAVAVTEGGQRAVRESFGVVVAVAFGPAAVSAAAIPTLFRVSRSWSSVLAATAALMQALGSR